MKKTKAQIEQEYFAKQCYSGETWKDAKKRIEDRRIRLAKLKANVV